MKAVVYDRYGPPEVLHLADVERPVPKDDEVLVRIHATSVTRQDAYARGGQFLQRIFNRSGFFRPKRRILGHELAGEIKAVGADVTEFEVGDRVFGVLPYIGLSAGTYAELIAFPARWPVVPIPEGMSFEQVGGITEGFMFALNALRPAGDLQGKDVLVYGASGSIGTAGVQLTRHFGAHVTAVCNTKNVELVRSLGPAEVIDYEKEDWTKNGKTYDAVLDAVGKHSFKRSKGSLKPGGVYLPTDGFRNFFLWIWHKRFGDKKVVFEMPRFRKEYVLLLKELLETGEYTPVVDRVYPLEDVVEATKYVETRQKTGNVVLTLTGGRAR
jgi:NADPH:quinone reductase-like Zn-dependent oxidoreductase